MKLPRFIWILSLFGLGVVVDFLFAAPKPVTAGPVIVHEWGTFTSLQDEKGAAISGINIDDEPAPNFVYQYSNEQPKVVFNTGLFGLPSASGDGDREEGYHTGDQQVILRLETPILYMYPPKGQTAESVPPLTVHVEFNGGVLSQYYPYAVTDYNDLQRADTFLMQKVTTSLTWRRVHLGGAGIPQVTDSQVWTTPRQVSAPILSVKGPTGKTQAENFLFYRGVAHVDSPLTTDRTSADGSTTISLPSNCPASKMQFTQGWIVEIRPDGSTAFRDVSLQHADLAGKLDAESAFQNADFSPTHLSELKASMHMALVGNGLYEDEATAMLNTWQLSYFQNPGLRFFFIVPRPWTDTILPLTIKGAQTDVTRVMIGRIELISPTEKQILARLRVGPSPSIREIDNEAMSQLQKRGLKGRDAQAYMTGQRPLSELGVTVPPLLQDFFSMGRFRDSLVLHELAVNPSPELEKFVQNNWIDHFP